MGAVTLGKPKVPHTTSASAHSRALSRSLSLARARARSLSLSRSLSFRPSLPAWAPQCATTTATPDAPYYKNTNCALCPAAKA